MEEAYRHEKESKEAIGRAIEMCSFHDLQDAVDTTDEGADENRLLPAMNKIWPYLIHCLKYKILVVRKFWSFVGYSFSYQLIDIDLFELACIDVQMICPHILCPLANCVVTNVMFKYLFI